MVGGCSFLRAVWLARTLNVMGVLACATGSLLTGCAGDTPSMGREMSMAGTTGGAIVTGGSMAGMPSGGEDDYPFLCNGPGQSCTDNAECCNKSCVAGKCAVKMCGGAGATCTGDSDCCDGPCRGGVCGDANTMCRTEGSLCAAHTECCTNTCFEGKCAPEGTMAVCDMALGPCDTWPQCGCADGETCHVLDFDTGTRGCKPSGAAGAYQACADTYDCAANHVCVAKECKQYCQEARDCPLDHPRCAPVGRSATETIPGFDVCWL